jgi:hypothetical protein
MLKTDLFLKGIKKMLFILQGSNREEVTVMAFPSAERNMNINTSHNGIISSAGYGMWFLY